MDSRVAYLNIWTILSNVVLVRDTGEAIKPINWPGPDEYGRPLKVNVAHNNVRDPRFDDDRRTSHVTWEFAGIRASFLALATFDGTGDDGTTLARFIVPGQKLHHRQKALVLLTYMQYAIESGHLQADWSYFPKKLSQDFDGGVDDFFSQHEMITRHSESIIRSLDSLEVAGAGSR